MKIFNSEFEISMRLLLLLDVFQKELDVDKLMYLDFFTIYSLNYGLGDENINGNNDFRLNDLMLQPRLFKNSIKELVLEGLAKSINNSNGVSFIITDLGRSLCANMRSDYSTAYRKNALNAYEKFNNASLSALKEYAKEKEVK